ncbi:MAG: LptF/LptG family permease [Spirochaetes bacterium]|nr:LptF/LptG family permease [Spirochaetota bacterium]
MLSFFNVNKRFGFTIVTSYILKEFFTTFIITFLFFFVIFFINSILLIIQPLLQKKLPLDLVIGLLVTTFPLNIIFSLPFGVLLATLMVMGRFSTDNEIVGFRACGFNYMKIFKPIFISGLIIGIITFIIYDRLVPASMEENFRLRKKIFEIKPTLGFKSKTIKKYDNMTIYTNIVEDTAIKGLIIIDTDENKNKRIITAEEAEILKPEFRRTAIELRMKNAMIQFDNKDRPNEFNYGYVDEMSYFIAFVEFDESSSSYKNIEKTTIENLKDVSKFTITYNLEKIKLLKEFTRLKESTANLLYSNEAFLKNNISERQFKNNFNLIDGNIEKLKQNYKGFTYNRIRDVNLNRSLIKFYQKFANPIACLIFAIFAAPIGVYSKRAGFSIGFIVGLFLSAIYWFSFFGLMLLSFKFILKPFLSSFLPNLIFLGLGLIFLIKRFKE